MQRGKKKKTHKKQRKKKENPQQTTLFAASNSICSWLQENTPFYLFPSLEPDSCSTAEGNPVEIIDLIPVVLQPPGGLWSLQTELADGTGKENYSTDSSCSSNNIKEWQTG